MAKRFSKKYEKFEDWAAVAGETSYNGRIKRLHALYPYATLTQLRGHAKSSEAPLSSTKKRDLAKLAWDDLTPEEKDQRLRARRVYFGMKKNDLSLKQAALEEGISPKAALRSINAFKKVNGEWRPKAYMRSEVTMEIYEHGKSEYVPIVDSRTAHRIGGYLAAVKSFMESGDSAFLVPYKGVKIKDSLGHLHPLETDPDILFEIHEGREEEEFYSIYGR